MSALKMLNSQSEVSRRGQALIMNTSAARGFAEVLKTNLGPKGTIKMLVSGAGDIRLTKDGNVLAHEMQIQHPTAALIARTATAQDDITGDGTTTMVITIGEFLRQSERYLGEGVHPRVIAEGFELAKVRALQFLEEYKVQKDTTDRALLVDVARASLRTKLEQELADQITEIVVDAVLTIRREKQPLDLFMVEIMTMPHRTANETRLVRGLVLDHGARHPDMPKKATNAFILTCNVSLEFEKTEVNSGFYYRSHEERQKMVDAEHALVEERCKKIIELANTVRGNDKNRGFIVINQKGIDPICLDMLAKANIIGLRRAKRRNMERLTLACGGSAINSVEDMTPEVLGHADEVQEQVLGEEKYTFIEGVKNPFSCTILIKGPNKYTIEQIKDAVRDGLRAVKNTIEDGFVVPGAGAFQTAAYLDLMKFKETVSGRAKLGVEAFANGLLIVPKTLAENSGFDATEILIKLQDEHKQGHNVGLDLVTGEPMDPQDEGVWDQYRVLKQVLQSSSVVAEQLLLVDEVMKAGKNMGRGGQEGPEQ
eukprot:TRINITY_DN7842_c0_g1_i1.p1 TRINITY_DN7842_c0_g1~~TRINITY_DN7842_c0_g1_i1.p1  ORF type:complete len:540 (+),score=123.71 TRINITY_DN7842_c0_g1_i1:84-1703(+)